MKNILRRLWWLGLLVLAADWSTKHFIGSIGTNRTVIPGLLEIHPVINHGIAFGMLQFSSRAVGIATAVLLAAAVCLWWRTSFSHGESTAIMLILAGAVGNMPERIALGGVQDFFYTSLFPFAVFNIADVAVVCGCIALCLLMIRQMARESRKKE